MRETTTIFSASLVYTTILSVSLIYTTITHAPAPCVTFYTALQTSTDVQALPASITRTIFATRFSIITSILLQPTTIYTTNLVPTTSFLTGTASTVEKIPFTTTIFAEQTTTVTAGPQPQATSMQSFPSQIGAAQVTSAPTRIKPTSSQIRPATGGPRPPYGSLPYRGPPVGGPYWWLKKGLSDDCTTTKARGGHF